MSTDNNNTGNVDAMINELASDEGKTLLETIIDEVARKPRPNTKVTESEDEPITDEKATIKFGHGYKPIYVYIENRGSIVRAIRREHRSTARILSMTLTESDSEAWIQGHRVLARIAELKGLAQQNPHIKALLQKFDNKSQEDVLYDLAKIMETDEFIAHCQKTNIPNPEKYLPNQSAPVDNLSTKDRIVIWLFNVLTEKPGLPKDVIVNMAIDDGTITNDQVGYFLKVSSELGCRKGGSFNMTDALKEAAEIVQIKVTYSDTENDIAF